MSIRFWSSTAVSSWAVPSAASRSIRVLTSPWTKLPADRTSATTTTARIATSRPRPRCPRIGQERLADAAKRQVVVAGHRPRTSALLGQLVGRRADSVGRGRHRLAGRADWRRQGDRTLVLRCTRAGGRPGRMACVRTRRRGGADSAPGRGVRCRGSAVERAVRTAVERPARRATQPHRDRRSGLAGLGGELRDAARREPEGRDPRCRPPRSPRPRASWTGAATALSPISYSPSAVA